MEIFLTIILQSTSVSSALQGQSQEVTSTIKTITTWVSAIMGLTALIQAILIFIGQGSGEEKIKKAGTWIFMLIFCALGFIVAQVLFPTK